MLQANHSMEAKLKTFQQKLTHLFQDYNSEFVCPITQTPMKNPVITEDGHSYDQAAIHKWLLISKKSPKTGLPLLSSKITPNINLRQLALKFNEMKLDLLMLIYNFVQKLAQSSFNKLNYEQSIISQEFPFIIESMKSKASQPLVLIKPKQQKKQSRKQPQREKQQKREKGFDFWVQKLNFQSHKQYLLADSQNRLLEPYDYLLEVFNFQSQQISDRYRKDRYSHGLGLWHNKIPIKSMALFMKHDWNVLEFLSLTECRLSDEDWIVFIQRSNQVLSRLRILWIYGNNISVVSQSDLMRFKKLETIEFWHYKGLSNPFTSQTKNLMRRFKSENKQIYIEFPE